MTPKALHLEALLYLDRADRRPWCQDCWPADDAEALDFRRRAFELESQAAAYFADRHDFEPTRSVMYRGAATLALRCGDFAEARRLCLDGLAGKPPEEIAWELREILVQAQGAVESTP